MAIQKRIQQRVTEMMRELDVLMYQLLMYYYKLPHYSMSYLTHHLSGLWFKRNERSFIELYFCVCKMY